MLYVVDLRRVFNRPMVFIELTRASLHELCFRMVGQLPLRGSLHASTEWTVVTGAAGGVKIC